MTTSTVKDPLIGVNDSGTLYVFRTGNHYPSYAKMPSDLTEEEQTAWARIKPLASRIARDKNNREIKRRGGVRAIMSVER